MDTKFNFSHSIGSKCFSFGMRCLHTSFNSSHSMLNMFYCFVCVVCCEIFKDTSHLLVTEMTAILDVLKSRYVFFKSRKSKITSRRATFWSTSQ